VRWMKHLAMAHRDVAMTAILEDFGAEGYGIYWLLLEHLAMMIEPDSLVVPAANYSIVRWSQICNCSVRRFRSFVEKATELRLIDSQTTTEPVPKYSQTIRDRLHIAVPKLLKYRDEYSKKSGVTPDSGRTVDRDRDREQIQSKEGGGEPEQPGLHAADARCRMTNASMRLRRCRRPPKADAKAKAKPQPFLHAATPMSFDFYVQNARECEKGQRRGR
jgi:hypothetical protein